MAEDFNKRKLIARKMGKTDFKQSWQFRLEIEGQPEDFDIYVKDITHGPTEIENDPTKAGGRTLTYPTGAAPVNLSMTVRDHQDERIAQWFDAWTAKVVNADGTLNLPYGQDGYVKKVKRFRQDKDDAETLTNTWEMYPVQRGDVTESRDEPGMLEFPITFIQFRS
jgi:hypothetical protein